MLPYAETETAIKKPVGLTEITELRSVEKELYTVTEKWEFHRRRTEDADETLRK